MRCVEGRVFLLRSTSTGVSAFVDATGRVVQRLDQDVRGTLVGQIPLLDIETGFEKWGNSVAWIGLMSILICLGLGMKPKDSGS